MEGTSPVGCGWDAPDIKIGPPSRPADGHLPARPLRGEQLAGPDLLRVEVLSVLRRQLAIGRLTADQAEHAVLDLLDSPLVTYPSGALLRRAWALRDNVTAYDACYVALAEALDCPLCTADGRLARAPGLTCTVQFLVPL